MLAVAAPRQRARGAVSGGLSPDSSQGWLGSPIQQLRCQWCAFSIACSCVSDSGRNRRETRLSQ
jgi:hypothetical protein